MFFFPRFFYTLLPEFDWSSPVFILAIGAVAVIVQKYVLNSNLGRQIHNGLADLYFHIHVPFRRDSSFRWIIRFLISFLLVIFGGTVGPEGPAIELIQAIRMKLHFRASKWFEQKRRTDVAASLSAGLSAAFGAPFAAALFPMEAGIGGRSITAVIGSLTAFLGIRLLQKYFSLPNFDVGGVLSTSSFTSLSEWSGVGVVGVGCSLLGVFSIRFIRYTQESLIHLFQTHAWMRIMTGAFLLALVHFIYRPSQLNSSALLEQVLWLKHTRVEVALYFCAQLLSLSLVLSGFGSLGLFWPLFTLGGLAGFCIHQWVLSGPTEAAAAAGLVGATVFWSVVLDAPLTSAVLAFELTQNLSVLLPCLVAGVLAQALRKTLKTPSLIHADMEYRGFSLIQGRSAPILEAVQVKDAMITDQEIIHEQEPITELQARVRRARYPFFLVVNSQGNFTGVLTVDVIQNAWNSQSTKDLESPIAGLVEAKDLLYRSGFKSPTVRATDRLSEVVHLFNEIPCVPVVAEDGKVIGLLFIHGVRLAYEREVARWSTSLSLKAEC